MSDTNDLLKIVFLWYNPQGNKCTLWASNVSNMDLWDSDSLLWMTQKILWKFNPSITLAAYHKAVDSVGLLSPEYLLLLSPDYWGDDVR